MYRPLVIVAVLGLGCLTSLAGCKSEQTPDYARPLGAGERALVRITDPARKPTVRGVFDPGDPNLHSALERSERWFGLPSTTRWFPFEVAGGPPITHAQARASITAMREVLRQAQTPEQFERLVYSEFEVYQSVGFDGRGSVLYTGYYSPTFRASRTPDATFRFPLYKRPDDLVTDPATGQTQGRRVGGVLQPYPSRRDIERSGMLRGQELVYLDDAFDAYLVQVQGSAELHMRDGSVMYVGYAGTNGHDYVSVGRMLIADGRIPESRLNLATLRQYFQQHPQDIDRYINANPRFVFFKPYDGDSWPAGSLGFKVSPMRTLATDKDAFPRGGVVMVHTYAPTGAGGRAVFTQLMLDQDTGGAIRAAGRGDIYFGVGDQAEDRAGMQYAQGQLYYFFLKPQRVDFWLSRGPAAQ